MGQWARGTEHETTNKIWAFLKQQDMAAASTFYPHSGPTYFRDGRSSNIDHCFVPVGALDIVTNIQAKVSRYTTSFIRI